MSSCIIREAEVSGSDESDVEIIDEIILEKRIENLLMIH